MGLYDKYLEKKYFSPSIGPILFGKNKLFRNTITLGIPSDSVQVAYDVCLLYASFIQMYYIAKARNNGTTIASLGINKTVAERIQRFWNCDQDINFADSQLFSFLISASSDPDIMTPDAQHCIAKVRTCFTRYRENYKASGYYDYDDLEELLSCFCLLKKITYSNGVFNIYENNIVYNIQPEPFIFFMKKGSIGDYEDPDTICNILTAIKKGDRNHEIYVVVKTINSTYSSDKTREICCQIEQESNLDIIFHTVGVSSKWYSTEEYLGDYTFLNNLIDCSKTAAIKFFSKEKGHISPIQDMFDDILSLFTGTDLYEKLITTHRMPIYFNEENESFGNFLFEVFINNGVCNTLTSLLFNEDEKIGLQLFDCYMNAFEEKQLIDREQKQTYCNECAINIEMRIDKLSKVLDRFSKGFTHRQREIEAEWRTYYILKAAGIKNERLFADVESIMSINDYFDMIKNPQASLQDSLKNVLIFLSSFYSALLNNTSKINYSKFARDFKATKKQLLSADSNIETMLDNFLAVIRASVNNKVLYSTTNRQRICPPEYFEDFAQTIKEALYKQQNSEENEFLSSGMSLGKNDRVFINYSHDDKDKVDEIVKLLKKAHINVYFDTDNFYGGDDWKEAAATEIQSDECKIMLAFTSKSSVRKEAVEYEITGMRMKNKPIIPINLEKEPLSDYLGKAKYDYDKHNKEKTIAATAANKIASVFNENVIFLSAINSSSDKYELNPNLVDDIIKNINKALGAYKNVFSVQTKGFTPLELAVANLYAFLKTSNYKRYNNAEELTQLFKSDDSDLSKCIYPLIASVKETQIRRDNITLLGYELIAGKNRTYKNINYILTARKLKADDYYCLPKCRYVGSKCQWMVEPLMIRFEDLT